MNPVIRQLMAHRSIRKFTDQPLEDYDLQLIVQAGQAAASSSHLQAYSLIRVQDQSLRQQLAALSGDQAYVAEAAEFLVVCADIHRHQRCCKMHNKQAQTGFTEQLLSATIDASLMAQNMVIAAESLGVGTVYIGGIRNQIAQVSQLLELPEQVSPLFGLCLGYAAQDPQLKPRLPTGLVLMNDRYQDTGASQKIAEYDDRMREYYLARTKGKVNKGWSDEVAAKLEKEARPHLLAYLNQQGLANK